MIIVMVVYSTYMNCEGLNVWMEGNLFYLYLCKYRAGLEHSIRVQKYHKNIIKVAHIPHAICKSFEIQQYLCVKNKPQFR